LKQEIENTAEDKRLGKRIENWNWNMEFGIRRFKKIGNN